MEEIIAHHGIKGMKWGVRRYQNADGSLTTAGKKRYADDANEDYKDAHSSKSISSMSDAELRKRLNRLQMEEQYSKMNPSAVDKGKDVAKKILQAGTTIATITSTALTIYNNIDKIRKIIGK